ncbi:hypothetical protein RFI_24752 [Reticulomyxa filosa]|uniref:Uncharacterized protein n=1 Tax=Reticulomyxa filosa TaxID=46433 RepID=X6MF23_RETFI|nr:hypothetical protein RFI_24752 [Reticulomyxa filosa]|eukprot:ETO12623.1 hypothetical protein RFI_24752 [Reticulomyxa filosa]
MTTATVWCAMNICSLVIWDYHFLETWVTSNCIFKKYLFCWCLNFFLKKKKGVFQKVRNVALCVNLGIAVIFIIIFGTLSRANKTALKFLEAFVKYALTCVVVCSCGVCAVVYCWMQRHQWIMEEVALLQIKRKISLTFLRRMDVSYFWVAIWFLAHVTKRLHFFLIFFFFFVRHSIFIKLKKKKKMITILTIIYSEKVYFDFELGWSFSMKMFDMLLLYLLLNIYKSTRYWLGTGCLHKKTERQIEETDLVDPKKGFRSGCLRRLCFNRKSLQYYSHVRVYLQIQSHFVNDSQIIDDLSKKEQHNLLSQSTSASPFRPVTVTRNDASPFTQLNINSDRPLSPYNVSSVLSNATNPDGSVPRQRAPSYLPERRRMSSAMPFTDNTVAPRPSFYIKSKEIQLKSHR